MSVKGLLPLGAAGASALGGLFASDDAEAGVSGLMRNLPEAIAAINKAVRSGAGQKNPIGALEDVMHNTQYSNYDEMNKYAAGVDGDTAGPYWKGEVQSMADQLREAGGLTDEADGHLQVWLDDHLSREMGYRPQVPKPAQNRAPKPQAPKNNAMAAALAAAAGVGSANAEEFALLGPGIPSAFGPRGEGSTPEQNGFTPLPDYDPTPVMQRNQDVMFGGPMGALGGGFSGGADEYGTVADGTMQSIQAGGRLLWGLLSGEGWDGATDSAGKVINQGVDATQQQFGEYIEDIYPGPEAKALGLAAQYIPYAMSPL